MTLRPEREDASTKDSRATAARNAKPGSKEPASRRARGPERQKYRPRNEEAGSESPRVLSMKDAKASAATSRQAGLERARQPRGARAPTAETSASQRRGRERELERGSRKGREDVPSEKPPSRARKSPLAAGREGPRGRNLGLAQRGRERELERSSRKGREDVHGEKPPSQARRSPPAAGREGPRGRNLGLALRRPRERARKGLS